MPARLTWTPDAGFVLDLDHEVDGVTVRFLAMPVPADGTAALSAGPVSLYALDLLFKSHVDLGDAPGQLHAATIRLVDGDLTLSAELEDAETGQTRPWSVTVPVEVAGEPPEAGGPVPPEPEEDDLDWDDDGADVAALLAAEDGGPGSRGGGLDALLAALARPEPADEPPAPDGADPDDVPETPPDDDALDAALLAALLGERGGDDQDRQAIAQARDFLGILLGRGEIELTDGASLDDLAPGVAPILARDQPAEAKAAALSAWLLAQEGVEELYVADEALEDLLERW